MATAAPTGVFGRFSSIFGSPPAAPAVAPAPGSDTAPGGPAVATQTTSNPAPTIPPSPLEQYSKLWETPTIQANEQNNPLAIFTQLDRAKMLESARKTNFVQNIPPEAMAKMVAGGEEGVRTMLAIINAAQQETYATAAFASGKIAEQGLSHYDTTIESRLPSKIKQQQFSESLRNANPLLASPAAAPIITGLERQFATHFPQATAQELTGMALNYLQDFSKTINAPADAAAKKVTEATGNDWEKFMS